LPICNLATFSVNSRIEICFDLESGVCRRTSDEPEHHIEIEKRLACPVHTYVAEQPVFYRVPFGARWRIMTKGDRQSEGITQFFLKIVFPRPKIVPVATTSVGKN
jgi:hypothetical protein